MDKKEKEMLEDVMGAIGWQGFDLVVYEDGSWEYDNKSRYESDPTAMYVDLEDTEYWDSYLEDFGTEEMRDGLETYEDVYERADESKKKEMLEALALAIGTNIIEQEEYAPHDDEL